MAKTFTPHRLRIINELRYGLSNAEIAKRLNTNEKNIKWHLTNIYKGLGVNSRLKLYVLIAQLRLNQDDEIAYIQSKDNIKLVAVPRSTSGLSRAL